MHQIDTAFTLPLSCSL